VTARHDVIVLGCGPAGERAAIQAARAGKRVAVVERARSLGGNRINWGTIPSKTLRESALFVLSLTRQKLHGIRTEIAGEITVADFMFRERKVVQQELDLVNDALDRYSVQVFQGTGRFTEPHTVAVEGAGGQIRTLLSADFIVIATGSSPNRPAEVPFDGTTVVDSETILSIPRMPRSMLVLGAGVIGIEYASIFAALGIQVTLVDTRDRLLPYCDQEIVSILEKELQHLGVVVLHNDRYEAVERLSDPPRVRCRTRQGNVLEADILLYCVGRDGNTADIGLQEIGIEVGQYGLLKVNENFQTVHPHVYAVGDVIGYPALASTSMEQGRRAIRHAYGIPGETLDIRALPFAVYSIPEVSYIGETEENMLEKGEPYVVGRARYDMNPRGQIIGDSEGMLKAVYDAQSMRLRGVHIIGSNASELIHVGQAFLRSGASAHQVAETPYNYPSLSDLYRHSAQKALGEHRKRQRHSTDSPVLSGGNS
jgi:NAD(P) transhydrogenase